VGIWKIIEGMTVKIDIDSEPPIFIEPEVVDKPELKPEVVDESEPEVVHVSEPGQKLLLS